MNAKFCEECGAALKPNAAFCEACGARIARDAAMPANMQPPEPLQRPLSQQQVYPPQQQPQPLYQPQQPPYAQAPASSKKGIFIALVVGVIVLVVAGIAVTLWFIGVLGGKKDANTTDEPTSQSAAVLPENNPPAQSDPSNVDTAATINDIAGTWNGEATCIAIDGLDGNEAFFAEQGITAENIAQIKSAIGQPFPMRLAISDTGDWEMEIDIMAGLALDPRELLSKEERETEPEKLNIMLTAGRFAIDAIHQENEGETRFSLTGALASDALTGKVSAGMAFVGGKTLTLNFDYTLTDFAAALASDTPNAPGIAVDPSQLATSAAPSDAGGSEPYSTTEIPTVDDFSWFTSKADTWTFGITPAKAMLMNDPTPLTGSWKGMEMIYDVDGTLLCRGYFTMTFTVAQPDVTAVIDWHRMDWIDSESEDVSSWEEETMYGSYPDHLSLGVPGNSIELLCYELDGKQYAEGLWTVQSGEEVRVALVRP